MVKTIWKYAFHRGRLVVDGLVEPKVVLIGPDPAEGRLAVWIEHSVETGGLPPTTSLTLTVVGTGWVTGELAGAYVGSVIAGQFVWHVYCKEG